MSTVPAGWYPNPHDPTTDRYWGGTSWSDEIRPTDRPPAPPAVALGAMPPNYLVWALLATVLTCMPIGAVAIVHACRVEPRWREGDAEGAQDASNAARRWCWWALCTALVAWVGFSVLFLVYLGANLAHGVG